ncbi:MAG TPA: ThiF family adenylyltransferase [Fimbriiglobus sp.]|nr:ThiF family adenylyltransferase [Fimbriiglobus sp.]
MAHILQVGAGSGGIVVLDLLARDPRVDRVTLVEPDVYKLHNVHRHLFPASAVGRLKAELAAEWLRERRPDLAVEALAVDLTAPEHQPMIERAAAACDVGVCAADNEPAKYHFDQLMRQHGKPWALGEVLSGGIAGWVHRFTPDGPCYGCVASYLQRSAPGDPAAPAPDYADPNGQVRETTVPAGKASIDAVASLHALVTLDLLNNPSPDPSPKRGGESDGTSPPSLLGKGDGGLGSSDFTSLLFTLARVPDVFDEPYRTHKFRVPRSLACLICSAVPAPPGEDLDAALDQALARLGHD